MEKHSILILDDEVNVLKSLVRLLEEENYNILTASEGKKALEILNTHTPSLIISDYRMPEMNGVEFFSEARRIYPDTIRVMLTGFTDIDAVIEAINKGEIYRYITKPWKEEEFKALIKDCLTQYELIRENKHLLDLTIKQNEELLKAAKLKENVEQITKHDLKSPLTVIIGLSDIILEDMPNLPEERVDQINSIKEAGYDMLELINRSLDLFKMENGKYKLKPTKVDVLFIIKKIIKGFGDLSRAKKIKLRVWIDKRAPRKGDSFEVSGEEFLCYSLLSNLIKNAIEASPKGESVQIFCTREKDMAGIEILNKGSVPEDIRNIFFQRFATSGKDRGTGLGTYSAKLTAEIQQGKIALDCSLAGETKVIVKLPKADN